MDSNQLMIHWSAAWALVGGVIVCTGCMHDQPITQNDESFSHEDDCKAKDDVVSMPWAELHQILDQERS